MAVKTTSFASDINLINSNTIVEGKIFTKGNLRIDGKIDGEIASDGSVVIGNGGELTGNLICRNLVSGGKLTGSVMVSERTQLESTAVFTGELTTKKLVIDEGSIFDGNCSMTSKTAHDEQGKEE